MKEKIVKLKNGGVLIYSKSKLNNCSAVEVGFKVGAFQDKKMGTAHFLEHTLFKKTLKRSNSDVENDRTKIAFLNASTSMDFLIIKFFRTNKLIHETMEFASDILLNSVVDDEYIESEKGVITEELNICLDGESRDIYVKNYKQAQSNARFSSDIVGRNEENIKSIKFSDLKKFKNTHFNGNNFIASVVSSLPLFKIKKILDEFFTSKIPFNPDYKVPGTYYNKNKIDKPSSLKIIKNNQEKITIMISFKIDKNELEIYEKNFNFAFLAKYISGTQGELFSKLRNKGLIYRIDSDYSCFKFDSLFNIVFETSKEKIKDIVEIIKNEIISIKTVGVDEKYIDAFKKNFNYFSDEKMPVKMSSTCHVNLMDYLSFGKVFRLSDRQKAKLINEVSSDGVKKVAGEIFKKDGKMFVTVLGNISKKFVPTFDYFENSFLTEVWYGWDF